MAKRTESSKIIFINTHYTQMLTVDRIKRSGRCTHLQRTEISGIVNVGVAMFFLLRGGRTYYVYRKYIYLINEIVMELNNVRDTDI